MEFDLREYQKINKDTKKKIFFEYLYQKCGIESETEKFDNEYFSILNLDDFVESLEYYIQKSNISAKITAENYISNLTNFYNELYSKYGIRNEVFSSIKLNDQFKYKYKKIIDNLKDTESKEFATDEEYLKLREGLDDYFGKMVSISDIYNEIDKFYYNRENKRYNVKYYNRYISAIAMKIIMTFGISSINTVLLNIKSIDIEKNIIKINEFELILDNELKEILKEYLEIRKYILELNNYESSYIFIKYNGDSFLNEERGKRGTGEYNKFFIILKDLLNTNSAERFGDRRVAEMLIKGIDINTIVKLTGKSMDRCVKLQSIALGDNKNETLNNFLIYERDNAKKIISLKKGYFKCPYCRKETKAVSDEWVLVQFKENDSKYLACKDCRGSSGKYA